MLGSKTINATWRNAYMTGAYELRLAREDGFSNEAGATLTFDNKGSMVAVLGGAVSPDDAIANGTLKIC